MRRRTVALAYAALAFLQACAGASRGSGDEAVSAKDDEQRYRATALVLEDRRHGPMLCLSVVLESLPPQCGDVPINNWDWDGVPGEERLGGTTWGSYETVGTYDGTSFTVHEVEPAGDPPPTEDDLYGPPETRCSEPEGGWVAPDPGRISEEDRLAAIGLAERQGDFAGVWVSHEAGTVLNVAFTGNLALHEAELSEIWGGPLCVIRHERTWRELKGIQRRLEGLEDSMDFEVLWSAVDVIRNVVELGVVVSDAELKAALDERFGEGAIRLIPALRPVR